MAQVNHETREIYLKLVYWGPAESGKTATLNAIYGQTRSPGAPAEPMTRGATSPAEGAYDFLPLKLPLIRGYATTFHLFTVPGAVGFSGVRRELLPGVDGVIFVADARRGRGPANGASFDELRQSLAQLGYHPAALPLVVQVNHTDDPDAMPAPGVADAVVGWHPRSEAVPMFASVATQGVGVFEGLKAAAKLCLLELKKSSAS